MNASETRTEALTLRAAMSERDMDAQPYSADEQRVADWLMKRNPGIGAGDDPIGFLMASYEYLHMSHRQAADRIEALENEGSFW